MFVQAERKDENSEGEAVYKVEHINRNESTSLTGADLLKGIQVVASPGIVEKIFIKIL